MLLPAGLYVCGWIHDSLKIKKVESTNQSINDKAMSFQFH